MISVCLLLLCYAAPAWALHLAELAGSCTLVTFCVTATRVEQCLRHGSYRLRVSSRNDVSPGYQQHVHVAGFNLSYLHRPLAISVMHIGAFEVEEEDRIYTISTWKKLMSSKVVEAACWAHSLVISYLVLCCGAG